MALDTQGNEQWRIVFLIPSADGYRDWLSRSSLGAGLELKM